MGGPCKGAKWLLRGQEAWAVWAAQPDPTHFPTGRWQAAVSYEGRRGWAGRDGLGKGRGGLSTGGIRSHQRCFCVSAVPLPSPEQQ